MAGLQFVFFDEPLATFSKICRVLGAGALSRKPVKPDARVVRVYGWPCGCRAVILRQDRCGIAVCDCHGEVLLAATAS